MLIKQQSWGMGYRLAAICTVAVVTGLLNFACTIHSLDDGAGAVRAVTTSLSSADTIHHAIIQTSSALQSSDTARAQAAIATTQPAIQAIQESAPNLPTTSAEKIAGEIQTEYGRWTSVAGQVLSRQGSGAGRLLPRLSAETSALSDDLASFTTELTKAKPAAMTIDHAAAQDTVLKGWIFEFAICAVAIILVFFLSVHTESSMASSMASHARLLENEARLRTFVRHAPLTLMAVDRDLVITVLEGKALPLPAGDHIGKKLTDVVGEGSGLVSGARQALAGNDVRAVFEAGITAYDVSLIPFRDDHGAISGAVGVAIDVSDRLKAERAMRSSEARYRSMFENAAQGIFQCDAAGQFVGANPALARMYGYESPEALIRAIPDLGSLLFVDKQQREEFITRLRAGRAVVTVETQVCRKDGSVLWVAGTAHAVTDGEGQVVSFEGTLYDVTERKTAETDRERQLIEALQQADRDPLTGLYNHRAFHLRVQLESERARREQLPLAAVMLTIKDLRAIADQHGRNAGEQLVIDVADALRQTSRTYDTISRYDVAVFALLLPGVGLAEAEAVAERFKRQVEHRVTFQPRGARNAIPVSLSCGMAVYPAEAANPLDVLEMALRRQDEESEEIETSSGADHEPETEPEPDVDRRRSARVQA